MPPVAATEAGPDGPAAWPRPRRRRGTAVQVPPQPGGRMGLAGLCHRPFGEGCTAQNAGDRGVAPPRRSTPGSPSSCWALEWTSSASCPAQNSRLANHGVPGQPLGNGYAMRPRLTSTARTGSSLAPERCASIPMRATLCTFTTGSLEQAPQVALYPAQAVIEPRLGGRQGALHHRGDLFQSQAQVLL